MARDGSSKRHQVTPGVSDSFTRRRALGVILSTLLLSLSACATAPDPSDRAAVQAYEEANDPLEPFNRTMFDVHQFLDRLLIKPMATIYRGVVPDPARKGVRNALYNLRTPVILVNDVLQGEFDRAGTTLTRFAVNTTVGVGGLMDPATDWGYTRHDEDFGQTLAVNGADEGPYLFLPLLGPAPVRDLAGNVVDVFFDPLTYIDGSAAAARFVVDGVDQRESNLETLDEIERGSIDYYATIRSLYRQRRAHVIANGETKPDSLPESPGFLPTGAEARLDASP